MTSVISSQTLFATHYHEMTQLESLRKESGIRVAVQERDGDVVFSVKSTGGADRSYASMWPSWRASAWVIDRAKEVLASWTAGCRERSRPTPSRE